MYLTVTPSDRVRAEMARAIAQAEGFSARLGSTWLVDISLHLEHFISARKLKCFQV
jgi:hypothetical protein